MSDWLLVRLARDGSQPTGWVTVSSSGQLLDVQGATDAQGLAAAAVGKRVALVVPGADVLQLSAVLPQGSESKLAQIVPYALEEQVAEDLDSLHFAVGRPLEGPGSPTSVDVVSRALLQRWLAVAADHGLKPVAVYADSGLLPAVPGQLTVLLDDETLLLRVGTQRPLVLPASDPAFALELVFQGDGDALQAAHLSVYATSLDWERHGAAFDALRARLGSLRVQLLSGGPLPLYGSQLLSAGAINLLQGAYAPARPAGAGWQAWQLAASLAAALLVLHLVAAGVELRRLHRAETALDSSIQEVFSQTMPGEVSGGNARARMEQRLAQIRAAAPERGSLLALLSAVASARAAAPGTRIDALSYRKGALDMKVTGPDAQSLELMNQSLRGAGLASDLASGSTKDKAYEGRLQLRGTGS
jgi:general secretion pathway protein L